MSAILMETVGAMPGIPKIFGAKAPSEKYFDALPVADQVLLRKLLTEPVDYVDHADFSSRGLESRLFGAIAKPDPEVPNRFLDEPDEISEAVQNGERIPALSYQQESHLFMRYNFARRQCVLILQASAGKKLTIATTSRLIAWGHRALIARSVVVRMNMPLVLAMAKRTRLSSIDFNELISEGNMALLRSVEKFDCSRGFKFSTYSCRAILKSFSRVAMRASRYRGQFPAEFDPAMERSDHKDRLRDDIERDCVDELKDILIRNLADLSAVERTVIAERFAISVVQPEQEAAPKTLEQVGLIIGVTKERVRQIQNKALRKIRVCLEDRYLAA